MKYTSNIKFNRFFSILFILMTTFCVLFTLGYFLNTFFHNSFLALIILFFYIYTCYCHNELKETIIKENYIEKEKYEIILKELLEKK